MIETVLACIVAVLPLLGGWMAYEMIRAEEERDGRRS